MFEVIKIQSLDLPELDPYKTMRWQIEHRNQGIFVAEGDKVVRRMLESTFEVVSLLVMEKWIEQYRELMEKRPELIKVYVTDRETMQVMTGFPLFQGALAVGKIPARPTLQEVLEKSSKPYLLATIDGITNASNVGILVRNAMAFNFQALIAPSNSCSPYMRRCVRNSMGAIFKLPVVETESLVDTLLDLKKRGVRCIAAHPHTDDVILSNADLKESCCIIFGNEGDGISPAVLEVCDSKVVVPMNPNIDSLNVGSASAVFMYEAARQRGFK